MDENEKLAGIPAIITAARAQAKAEVVNVALEGVDLSGTSIGEIPMLLEPGETGGVSAQSVLDEVKRWRAEFATRPVRRSGTATLEELDSFIAHTTRFRDENSAVFVSGGSTAPKFTSILDYHEALNIPPAEGTNVILPKTDDALPRFGQHRGVYSPKFSPEWEAWKQADGRALGQEAFARLITDQVRTVLDVTPVGEDGSNLRTLAAWFASKYARKVAPEDFYADSGRMLEMANGLTISVNERVVDVGRLDNGETAISWNANAEASIAGQKTTVPVAFVLELPIFVGGAVYQLPVRLRLTTKMDGDMKRAIWTILIFGAAESVLACVADMRAEVAAKTGLPVFAGSPE